jgi:hypothetical protein
MHGSVIHNVRSGRKKLFRSRGGNQVTIGRQAMQNYTHDFEVLMLKTIPELPYITFEQP